MPVGRVSKLLLVAFVAAVGPVAVARAELPQPKGIIARPDSAGSLLLSWVYPGVNETSYAASSGAKSKACYISAAPGSHQLACAFTFLPDHQWLGRVEVWIEKGPGFTEERWLAQGALSLSIAANSAGRPGLIVSGPLEVCPAEQGISETGGYLQTDFDLSLTPLFAETLWVVLTWPSADSGMTRFGVDDQPRQNRAFFRPTAPGGTPWQPWPEHNPMIALHTLRYSTRCTDPLESSFTGGEIRPALPAPDHYVISREEQSQRWPAQLDPFIGWITGDQGCARDTCIFVGYTYTYSVRAVVGMDSSAAAIAQVSVPSTIPCNWRLPDSTNFATEQGVMLPFFLENQELGSLQGRFMGGWLEPSPSPPHSLETTSFDSIPLWASCSIATANPGAAVSFQLHAEQEPIPAGGYTALAHFDVVNPLGRRERYEFLVPTQVFAPIVVNESGDAVSATVPRLVVFPNPTLGGIQLEFTPPPAVAAIIAAGGLNASDATSYVVTTYDILGREVSRTGFLSEGVQAEKINIRIEMNKDGNPLSPGVYFIRVAGRGWSACRKVVVLH